jgi:hypothetical protein
VNNDGSDFISFIFDGFIAVRMHGHDRCDENLVMLKQSRIADDL